MEEGCPFFTNSVATGGLVRMSELKGQLRGITEANERGI